MATSASVPASVSATRSHIATVAPNRASSPAVAFPIPAPAPVTSATRPVSSTDDGPYGTEAG